MVTPAPKGPHATDRPVVVQFDGHPYKVPPADAWPSKALEMMFDGNLPGAMRLIVGDKVYTEFDSRHPTIGDLKRFMEAMGEQAGSGN